MTANHKARVLGPGKALRVRTKRWTIHADVQKQDPNDEIITPNDIERQEVRKSRCAVVDVPAYRQERRNILERREHRQVANVAGVEDRVRRKRDKLRKRIRVWRRVRVRDDRQSKAAIVPDGHLTARVL